MYHSINIIREQLLQTMQYLDGFECAAKAVWWNWTVVWHSTKMSGRFFWGSALSIRSKIVVRSQNTMEHSTWVVQMNFLSSKLPTGSVLLSTILSESSPLSKTENEDKSLFPLLNIRSSLSWFHKDFYITDLEMLFQKFAAALCSTLNISPRH